MAYVAGIFDGDGSFSLIREVKKGKSMPYYYPMIQLANVSKTLVDFLVAELGGTYQTRASYVAKDGSTRQVCYGWRLSRPNACMPFLENVSPYLVIKKERADFLMHYLTENPYVPSNKSDDSIYERENAYLKMKNFNSARDLTKKFSKGKRTYNSDDSKFWSYIAGLMDTDGSFSIKKEMKRSRKNATYSPAILISMIDIRAMNHIYDNCTLGNFTIIKARSAIQGFCYRFGIFSKKDAIEFLGKIIPFLIIKKESASALMEFCKNMDVVSHRQNGIPAEELQRREEFYQQVKQSNQYGVFKSSLIDLEG